MNQRRLRVLVSAYACEPGKGSEPGVGWNWVLQISRFHEVWVITRANNRGPIDKALVSSPLPNVRWVYFDLPYWARFWKKGQRGVHLYYYLWQLAAYFRARELHRQVGFDLSHHVTFVIDWQPSFLCLLPIPFVWGPVGGSTHHAPLRFWTEFGWRGVFYELARTSAILTARYLDPLVWLTRRKARAIVTMSKGAVAGLPRWARGKTFALGNVGLSSEEIPRSVSTPHVRTPLGATEAPVVFTTGRLVHWKGYTLLLKACASCLNRGCRLAIRIGGSGPAEGKLRKLVRRLGIADHVTFLGRLRDRESVFSHLMACDIFVMPTLHDGPPVVFLEAMAVEKPVVCLDLGGATEIVTPQTGIKVPAISPRQAVSDLAEAIGRLAEDPCLRARLGAAGRRRVEEHLDWDEKGLLIARLYDSVLAGNGLGVPGPSSSLVVEGSSNRRRRSEARL